MTEGTMEENRLLQIFLSPEITPGPGIYEVSLTKSKSLVCTCPGFVSRNKCKHVTVVKSRASLNDGNYPLKISTRVKDEDAVKAAESSEAFREFVIKFGEIEVY